jgi:cysteine synthase
MVSVADARVLDGNTGPDKIVVTLLPDTGERYLSTELFDEPQRGQHSE